MLPMCKRRHLRVQGAEHCTATCVTSVSLGERGKCPAVVKLRTATRTKAGRGFRSRLTSRRKETGISS